MPEPFPSALVGRPFVRAEALALGVTPRRLDAARVRRLHRGVRAVLPDGEPTLSFRVAAALRVLPPETLATSVTGLQLVGVGVGPDLPLTFCSSHPHPVRRPGIVVSRVRELPPHDGRLVRPADCFAAAATELGLVDAVAAGDWLLHLGRATPEELTAAVNRRTRRHLRRVRRALALVRPGAESPRESRLRLVLVLAGLPEPLVNLTVRAGGRFVGRADLLFEAYRVVVEYDGLQHLTDRRQWESDIQRLERFEAAGYVVIRVTAARLAHPRRLVADVDRALRVRGYRGPAPVFTDEWLACFA